MKKTSLKVSAKEKRTLKGMHMKKRAVKTVVMTFLTILLVLVTAFCIKGTARSMEKVSGYDREMESYYRSLEKDFVKRVSQLCKEYGFDNAGINLTKVVNANSEREYTLSINHRRIAKNPEKVEKLKAAVEKTDIGIDGVTLRIMTTF